MSTVQPPEDKDNDAEVAASIRAVAESREDSEVIDLVALGGDVVAPPPEDELTAEELRDAWPLLGIDERADGLRVLDRAEAEEFFIALPPNDQARLLAHFPPGQRRQWMRLLEPDDAADLIQAASADQREPLLALLDVPVRREVTVLLAYAEDEAGGLMSTRYARLRPQMTADEALGYLRRQARDRVETIYYSYVLDAEQRLHGVVSFRDLITSDPSKTIADLMETDVQRVTDEMDQETVARLFAVTGLTVIPVVDRDGKMKGIVTIDDVVDVVREEATEDAQKFGGMDALDLPYLENTRAEMIKKRGRWLTILLVGEMFTATALGFFQSSLIPLLALFIPLIISTGGNSGSQASTLVVRAIALGQVRGRDWWLVLRRELAIGLWLGVILGAFAAVRVLVWGVAGRYGEHYGLIGITVALAITGCVTWGTLAGSMLPFLLRKLGADPANASAPLVATLVDVSGIVIYFTLANLILSTTLLAH